jgi:type III restriction enzyme
VSKERLLSFEEPVSFIFAHSALKEGWDNPNVFQICTLNQTVSEMKKRQEIGRGLRLAVDQTGERVFDEDVNVLTVVANEGYERYVSLLQTEYEEAGQVAPNKPTRKGKATAQRNDAVFQMKEFREFWERLSQRSHYSIEVDTPELIDLCIERLVNDTTSLKPVIVVERGEYVVTEYRMTLLSINDRQARIKVEAASTAGQTAMFEQPYELRDDLAKLHNDERLRGFKIVELVTEGVPKVAFDNGQELTQVQPLLFRSEAGQRPVERSQLAPTETFPVPNLLDRAARETGLTRATLRRVFDGLPERKRALLLRNPEGFVGWFIGVVRGALADHVVSRLSFVVMGNGDGRDLEQLFPPEKEFPQKELVAGGQRALYDQVQVDSGVEIGFVEKRLRIDDKVVCFFKLPAAFRIPLPKVVGSYNPDWGILRWSEDGEHLLLHLVRETKGAEGPRQLQFAHERRKVAAAKRHFRELGVDYRVVTDETADWWEPEDEQEEFS